MGRILGYIGSRSHLLQDVLARESTALSRPLPEETDGWGIGFYQNSEVLHTKRPHGPSQIVDWKSLAGDVKTDCAIAHIREATVGDFRMENVHPFRMRQWLFAQTGTLEHFAELRGSFLESMPDFLQRNIRGETDSECVFHTVLAVLHEKGWFDRTDLPTPSVMEAIREALNRIDTWTRQYTPTPSAFNFILTNGRTLYALRRGSPMFFVDRGRLVSLPPPGVPDSRPPQKNPSLPPLKYVLVVSDGSEQPTDYHALENESLLTVDRDLQIRRYPLR